MNLVKDISEMIDMLPESDQNLLYELVKKMVLAWDADFTKLTPAERVRLEAAQTSGYISADDIDFDNLNALDLDD